MSYLKRVKQAQSMQAENNILKIQIKIKNQCS